MPGTARSTRRRTHVPSVQPAHKAHNRRAPHLDHHELVIDPANPNRIPLGTDGGVFQSCDWW